MSDAADTNLREAQRWLQQAAEHLAAAKWAAQGGHHPQACFQFQQAAELALKALLIRQGEHVRVHGLLHLVEVLRPYHPDIGRFERTARRLDRFYIATRYPDALPTGTAASYFGEEDSAEAQTAAEDLLTFAQKELGQP